MTSKREGILEAYRSYRYQFEFGTLDDLVQYAIGSRKLRVFNQLTAPIEFESTVAQVILAGRAAKDSAEALIEAHGDGTVRNARCDFIKAMQILRLTVKKFAAKPSPSRKHQLTMAWRLTAHEIANPEIRKIDMHMQQALNKTLSQRKLAKKPCTAQKQRPLVRKHA